jgi:hypothetical protein
LSGRGAHGVVVGVVGVVGEVVGVVVGVVAVVPVDAELEELPVLAPDGAPVPAEEVVGGGGAGAGVTFGVGRGTDRET